MHWRGPAVLMVSGVTLAGGLQVACGGDAQPPGTAGAAGAAAGASSAGAPSGGRSTASGGTSGTGGTAGAAVAGGNGGSSPTAGAPNGGSAGQKGSAGAAGSHAGTAGSTGCANQSQTKSVRTAKSAGFSGSYEDDYYPLYDHACSTLSDCATACVTAGGTATSCAASECIDSSPDYCLPPTYWFQLDQLLVEGGTVESSAQIIMVNNPYRDQLLLSNFQFEIPAGATISGVEFDFNESADAEASIADFNVRALAGGQPVGLDRAHTTAWTTDFHDETYGGATDLWGTTWTPAQINAADFGVALTPMYLWTAGNDRAYVDFVRATVYYDACE
ncbi:MAG: hypothetical protein ABW061_09420 [Polyangiaceae bacterium]